MLANILGKMKQISPSHGLKGVSTAIKKVGGNIYLVLNMSLIGLISFPASYVASRKLSSKKISRSSGCN